MIVDGQISVKFCIAIGAVKFKWKCRAMGHSLQRNITVSNGKSRKIFVKLTQVYNNKLTFTIINFKWEWK